MFSGDVAAILNKSDSISEKKIWKKTSTSDLVCEHSGNFHFGFEILRRIENFMQAGAQDIQFLIEFFVRRAKIWF